MLFTTLGSMLLRTTNEDQVFLLFLCSHMFSNSSSLFISMSNLIWIDVNTMDMKRHVLIFLLISMLLGREKKWDRYKDRR
jgi:hypothetical protein